MKESEITRQLHRLRDNQNKGGAVAAHLNDSGLATPMSGDEEAPFTKANPFVTQAEQYWFQVDLPDADTAYLTGPTIDVTKWRTLIIYVFSGGQLSLLPQAGPDLDNDVLLTPDLTPVIPIGVIDPTLTPVTILGSAQYASRNMYRTELRGPVEGIVATFAFDVSMYSAFNFQAAEIDPGGTPSLIFLTYSLSM